MPPQPPASRLSLKGLVTFPYRLCNPPPAVGKVRSCGVTPILNVRLEDVLARRHLPPIGLKDLEEYLLYVERTPENLYFILWLKDYTARYHAWVQREKVSLVHKKDKSFISQQQKFPVPPTPDPSLAMFYLRAKQTFFTPNGEYELNIPSDVLAPFHYVPHTHSQEHSRSSLWHSQSIHPDPAVFSEVAMEAQAMLNESLKRFVRAAYTNVGSQRAICGIIAGCTFTLLSGAVPLVLTTGGWNAGPHGHLIRLCAFPGLWLGLTVLIASLQGVCLMIYFFGDLRQLRKFELTRPTISRPMPMPEMSPLASGPTPHQSLYVPSRSVPPMPEKMPEAVSPIDSPKTSFTRPMRHFPKISATSLAPTTCESCYSEDSGESFGCNEIDISPALYDDMPAPEGPATASCLHRPEHRLPPSFIPLAEPAYVRQVARSAGLTISTSAMDGPAVLHRTQSKPSMRSFRNRPEYGPTAGFIPSDYRANSASSLAETPKSLRSQQSACYFDFDALPTKRPRRDSVGGDSASLPPTGMNMPSSSSVVVDPSSPHPSGPSSASPSSPSLSGIGALLGRRQYKCNHPSGVTSSSSVGSTDKRRRKRFAMLIPSFTAGVPAFAAPLTQVQSPVVKRAQWEVVIRAGTVAAILAGTLAGIVVIVIP